MNQQNVFINFVYSRVINGEQTYKAGTARILLLRFTWYALLWAPLLRTKSSGESSLPLGLWRDLRDGLDMRRPAVLFIPELLQTKKIKIEKINYQFQYIYMEFLLGSGAIRRSHRKADPAWAAGTWGLPGGVGVVGGLCWRPQQAWNAALWWLQCKIKQRYSKQLKLISRFWWVVYQLQKSICYQLLNSKFVVISILS